MQGIPLCERIRHLVSHELRAIRAQHGLSTILPAASRVPGYPGDRLECGQLRIGAARLAVLAPAAAGALSRAPDRSHAQHPGAVQVASVLGSYQPDRGP